MKLLLKILLTGILILFSTGIYGNDYYSYRFRRISPEGGFYHSGIQSITQDADGYIWFNTKHEVFRFDAYSVIRSQEVLTHDNQKRIAKFNSLYTDKSGNLWLSTNLGLFKYNKFTSNFEYEYAFEDNIDQILEDNFGNLWVKSNSFVGVYDRDKKSFQLEQSGASSETIYTYLSCFDLNIFAGTNNGEVLYYDYLKKRFVPFCTLKSRSTITSIVSDNDHVFILSEKKGLFKYNKEGVFQDSFDFFLEDNEVRGNNIGKELFIDNEGTVWIATHRGLYLLNSETGSYHYYYSNTEEYFSLPNNSIWTIFADRHNGIWIGTHSGGLAYANLHDHKFRNIRHTKDLSLNNNFISSFAEDHQGNLWIGTEGGGLSFYNRKSASFKFYSHQDERNSLSYDNVKALVLDKDNNLWIGMYNGGLDRLNIKTNQFLNYKNIPGDNTSLSGNHIYALQPESDSGIWIANQPYGLDFFHFKNKTFSHYNPITVEKFTNTLHYINGLYRGSNDRLWIASSEGLLQMCVLRKTFRHFQFNPSDTFNIGDNEVFCVHEDNNKNVWIGTRSHGLYSFDPVRSDFTHYPFGNKFVANAIYSILDDNAGNIWFSSNNGLFMFEVSTGNFHRYDRADGLQGNLFSPNASAKCRSGELIFGGTNGITVFHPDSIKKNPYVPEIVLTKLMINNSPVNFLPDSKGRMLDINALNKIELSHNQNVFGLEMSAFNFLIPEKNRFAYKLEGYDNEWNYTTSNQRLITYSNLPQGKYRLLLNASNNDGVWHENEKSIMISILPPPWKSNLAYTLYLLAVIILLIIIFRIVRIRRNYLNQLRFERFSKIKMAELNNLKIQFFTNISHEFKTPLTLIISPLNKILKSTLDDENTRKNLELVQRNVIRLQNLINQLMSFRALENNKVSIKNSYGDLVVFLKDLADLFKPIAEDNNIHFIIDSNIENFPTLFDHDKFEKIFYNLFSNAVKFTPSGGHVILQLDIKGKAGGQAGLSGNNQPGRFYLLNAQVINNGCQIPSEQLKSIFDNTYQTGWADTPIQNGSGLGLTFTRELIKLLQGEIKVTSSQLETCFNVTLPVLAASRIPDDESVLNQDYDFDYSLDLLKLLNSRKFKPNQQTTGNKLPKLLIVEDNPDLQCFLHDLFYNDFHILIGNDGKEGLKLARDYNPVLVISDVLMPNVSGCELCKSIKSDITTSHIPVILLSALNEQEDKIMGMEAGADVYIEKPFDPEYLKLQVINLLQSREYARLNFSRKLSIEPSSITPTSTDEIFLKRTLQIVEKHISETEFNVDMFVSEMGMSRTLLYQKIKALTDLSVNNFILNIRLKRAAQLIKDTDLTISEISYMVGFNEPKYFSTCFRKFFNQSPKAYKDELKSHSNIE